MGFEIRGINPKHKPGEYFRRTASDWNSLWDFICFNTLELTEEDRRIGHITSGHIINGNKHQAIIKRLQQILKSYNIKELKLENRNNLEEFLLFLENNEGFRIC